MGSYPTNKFYQYLNADLLYLIMNYFFPDTEPQIINICMHHGKFIVNLDNVSYVTATGPEPITTQFVNEHSTIWPNWPNDSAVF